MPQTEAVEIGWGSPVECSRRLLSAVNGGNARSLKRELARASRISGPEASGGRQSSLVEEQKELLDAILEGMRVSNPGYEPCVEAEIFLLGHLAGINSPVQKTSHAVCA